jgi:pimeloyl-ACP methyl ester carboxylesterase
MKSQKLKVPGAVIYHEVRGDGPLLILIPGGPTDADIMAPLASLLKDRFTVVSYDPRGNSRSIFDGDAVEQSLDVHGDDVAALISQLNRGPAFLFGNSGGAQIGLNLCARYPALVRKLVAHEPPCISLLEDANQNLQAMNKVVETYHVMGAGPAMGLFMQIAGMNPPERAPARSPSTFMKANLAYFLEYGVKPIGTYLPDVKALRNSKVVVGVGAESEGQLAHRSALALAKALNVEPIVFPDGHSGWVREPAAFAKVLSDQLI